MFQTGWFVMSLASQVLVVFAIRTRRPFFQSQPNGFLLATAGGVVALACALPFLPIAAWFGLVAPPVSFFFYLTGATLTYLAIVEFAKSVFYRVFVPPPAKSV